ncbi:MAG: urea carboxylase-associated family protein [Bacteriovorax sp.]|nr:urea carboxylase-associated family protein [Rhizobacter sp.]
MQTSFATLSALARAAVPDHSTPFSPELVLWQESLPGGAHWSGRMRRGTTLRLTDVRGGANVSALFYNAAQTTERYNMPDSLKAQHTAFLGRGTVCYSDMGRVLCSIPEDSCGWHDTLCGVLDTPRMLAKYGASRYQAQRNDMMRSGLDGFLIELGKWGLGKRDVVANVNFFSKVTADDEGHLHFDSTQRPPGQCVDLRFEMDTLVVVSAAPHPLDPAVAYAPQPVDLTAWRSGTAGADDVCRLRCPENDRGFINTERWWL